MSCSLDEPPPDTAGEAWVDMLKEQMLFLPLDEYGEAVTRVTVIGSPGGAEVAHCFD